MQERALPALRVLKGPLPCFPASHRTLPSHFSLNWLQRHLSMSSRLNQTSRRQPKSSSFRVQVWGANPSSAIYEPCDLGQVTPLLICKKGNSGRAQLTGFVWGLNGILQANTERNARHTQSMLKKYPDGPAPGQDREGNDNQQLSEEVPWPVCLAGRALCCFCNACALHSVGWAIRIAHLL